MIASVNSAGSAPTDGDLAHLSSQCREYIASSLALLRKAERCRKGHAPVAASLYGWGAAEDITKAVGENWKDCGVAYSDERDLRTLVDALLVHDSEFMRAVAEVCDGDSDFSEKQRAIDEMIVNQPVEERNNQLDVCFRAAVSLRESFYDGDDISDRMLEYGLQGVARYINRMLLWLHQPHPPQGFRQYRWQEPFTLPAPAAERTE